MGAVQNARFYEDQRLLYVALTRAADHLYVCGYGSKVTADSWYQQIIDRVNPTISNWQAKTPANYKADLTQIELPDWLTSLPRQKVSPPAKNIVASPQTEMMHRGVVVHKLFEVLGDISPAQRREQGARLLNLMQLDLSEWRSDLEQVVNMLDHPDLTPFFGGDSFAELEIIHPDGSFLRLDRVVIGSHKITILDYKTSLNVPTTIADIPRDILKQLQRYTEALANMYPSHEINSVILWTSAPLLQTLPHTCLGLNNTGA